MLTAREWIELIADPEIREKALAKLETDPHIPDSLENNVSGAIMRGFIWDKDVSGTFRRKRFDSVEWQYWDNLHTNPPALLPIPNKEREAADKICDEFLRHINQFHGGLITEHQKTDFLNQKYPTNG